MAADATFFFDTNIDTVVGQIRNGLTQIAEKQSALEREQNKPSNDTGRNKAIEEYNALIQESIQKIGRLNALAKDSKNTPHEFNAAKNLNAGIQTIVSQADKELGRIAARHGVPLEIAAELRKNSIGQLVATANRELGAARLELPVVLVGTRGVSSQKKEFDAGYEKPNAAAAKPATVSTARVNAEAVSDKAIAQRAENDKSTAAASKQIADSTEQRAESAKVAAKAQAGVTQAVVKEAADFSQAAPPKQTRAAGGAGAKPPATPPPVAGGADDGEERLRLNAERAQRIFDAAERYLARLKKLGKSGKDIDDEELHAEFLRGSVTRGKYAGTSRTSGFDKGVTSFAGEKYLLDSRADLTEISERTARGYKALLAGTEPFIRAQEVIGAEMAKKAERLFTLAQKGELPGRDAENLRRAQANAERIRQGAAVGERFGPKVYDLGKGLVSDQSQGKLDFLQKQTDGGYRELSKGTGEYLDAMHRYVEGIIAEKDKANAARLRDADARVVTTQKRAVATFKGLAKEDVAQEKQREASRKAAEAAAAAADKEELAQANARLNLLTRRAKTEFKNLDKSDAAQVAAHEKAQKEIEAAQKEVDRVELKLANDRLAILTRRARSTFKALDKADATQDKTHEKARKDAETARVKAEADEQKARDQREAQIIKEFERNAAALPGRIRQRTGRENNANLLDGTKGNRFQVGVVETGEKQVADTRGDLIRHYKRAADGLYDEITKADELAQAERALTRVLAKEALDRQKLRESGATTKVQENLDEVARNNARRLYDPTRKGGLTRGAVGYSSTGVANIVETEEDGVKKRIVELYRRVGDGLHQLAEGSQGYHDELTKFERSGKGGRGISGGFVHGLTSGGFGGSGVGGLEGLAQSAGTTAKYSALYSVLGLLQQGLAQAGAEMVNFADSNTDLGVAIETATGHVQKAGEVDHDYVATLEGISITAGSNVGDVQDIVAAGIRTIGTDSDYSAAQVRQLGADFAEQAQRMAILAKTDIKDAAGNLRAISSAYDIKLDDSARINDALVTGKNVGGGDEKQTAQAVATAGEAAKNAGFTLEAISAIASRIQGATDQSGQAVGNKLSKIFSIVGGSAGQNAITKLNQSLPKKDQINLNATIYEQLLALSKLQKSGELDKGGLKKGLVNSLGGTSAAKEFITILEDLDDVVDNNGKGLNHAGSAAEEYQKKLLDLSVTVREFQGALKAIIVNIGNSGALDLLVVSFQAVVNALKLIAQFGAEANKILNKFDVLGAGAGRWAIRIGEVGAALLLVAKIAKEGNFGEFLGSFETKFRPEAALAREQLKENAASKAAEALTGGDPTEAVGALGEDAVAKAQEALTEKAEEAVSNATAKGVGAVAKLTTTESAAAIQAAVAEAGEQAAATAALATAGIAEEEAARVSALIVAAAEESALIAATAASAAAAQGAVVGGAGAGAAGAIGGAVGAAGAGAGRLAFLGRNIAGAEVTGARLAANQAAIRGIGSAGAGLASVANFLKNPVTLAVGGFIAIAALKSKADEVGESMRGANRALKEFTDPTKFKDAKTEAQRADVYRNIAAGQADAKAQLDKSRSGLLGHFFKSDENQAQSDSLKAGIAYAQSQADALEKSATKTGNALNDLAIFGEPATRSTESITNGLAALTAGGVSAEERLRRFNLAIGATGDTATRATSQILKKKLAQTVAQGLTVLDTQLPHQPTVSVKAPEDKFFKALAAQNPGPVVFTKADGTQVRAGDSQLGGQGSQTYVNQKNPLDKYFGKNIANIQKLTLDNLPDTAANTDGSYSQAQGKAVGQIVAQKVVDEWMVTYNTLSSTDQGKPENDPKTLSAFVQEKVQGFIAAAGNITGERQAGTKAPLADIYTEITAGTEKFYADLIANLLPGDDAGKIDLLKAEGKDIAGKIKDLQAGDSPASLLQIKYKVLAELGQAEVDSDEKMRAALQAKAKGTKAIAAIGDTYFTKEFDEAYKSGNLQLILDILNRGSENQVAAVRKTIEDDITLTKAAIAVAKVTADLATLGEFGGDVTSDEAEAYNKRKKEKEDAATKADRAKLQRQQAALGQVDLATPDNSINTSTGTGDNNVIDQAELDILKRNAGALGAAKLDAARRKVNDAQTRLDAIRRKYGTDSKEYYAGLASLNQSKDELAQDELDAQKNAKLLKIDLTDPVAVARADLKDAKARRAAAVKAANNAINADGSKGLKGDAREEYLAPFDIDVRNKQAGLENTAVSEYLSNAETSLRLGRISHSTYMALLKAKRDQLQVEYDAHAHDAQGQDQRKKLIDSLTQTIKGAASELDGQFNLGDIKIPTVYQVRRSIKAKTAGDVLGQNGSSSTAGNVVNDTSTKNVVLNGVPIEKVVSILENLFGIKARTTTGKRRK